MKVMLIFGTRPEAIKMAPLFLRLKATGEFAPKICVTAQHRQMLDQVLELFGIQPEYDLNVMRQGQGLSELTGEILRLLDPVLAAEQPDLVMVHGDTTTTLAASLAGFYRKLPLAHVEAGLRTGDLWSPWPEELNRRVAGLTATLHFAPTPLAKDNLVREGIDRRKIFVTGNTVIDSLLYMVGKLNSDPGLERSISKRFDFLVPDRKLILVTGHRRESFGQGFRNICEALKRVALNHPECQVVYPVHLNPMVIGPVKRELSGLRNVTLIDPQDYLSFVYLMNRAYCILTDSGGVQEEAAALRKPVLVMRTTTERVEAVEAGGVQLVGTDVEKITQSIAELVMSPLKYESMINAATSFGDGTACRRIVDELLGFRARVLSDRRLK